MRSIWTCLFSLLAAIAGAQPPTPIEPGTPLVFVWDMEPLGPTVATPDAFRLCIDATCAPIAVTYAATMSTPIPAMTPGRHTIRVQACKTYPAPRGEVCKETSLGVEMLVITSPAQPANIRLGPAPAPAGGGMADPALVSGQLTGIKHGSETGTFPVNVTAGNALVVWASRYQSDLGTTDASGSVNGTMTRGVHLQRGGTGDERVAMYYLVNIAAGTEQITLANAGNGTTFIAAEFSGVVTVSPVDASVTNSATGVATTTNLTASTASSLLLAALTHNGGNDTITPAGTMTEVGEEQDNVAFQCLSALYRILTASGDFSGDWTTSHTYGAVGLLLKGQGAGGVTTRPPQFLSAQPRHIRRVP